jgi:hypothetical protein
LRSDWEMYRPHVADWATQERLLRSGDDVAARADLTVDNGLSDSFPVNLDREREFVYWDRGALPAGSSKAALSKRFR